MRVLRVGFVGTRTANVEATNSFFRDVLHLESVRDDPEWAILRLPTGHFDFVEVYGPGFDDVRLAPADVGSMIGFVVDELGAAHEEVRAAGIEVSDLVWAREISGDPDLEGYGWFFVKAPDGNTYVIQQVPDLVL